MASFSFDKHDGSEVRVEVHTAPLKLTPPSELLSAIQSWLELHVPRNIALYQVNPEALAEVTKPEIWTQALTRDLKVPIGVKAIYAHRDVMMFGWRMIFGIEMNQEIVDAYESLHQNELLKLIQEME